MATYIYNRVSTFEQAVHGFSLDAQAKLCIEYCKQHGLVLGEATNCGLPGVIVDGGKSAYKQALGVRPGGQLLIKSLRSGDTIVATCINRLFRRIQDAATMLEHWVERGVNVVFTDYPSLSVTTANGKAMIYILATMGQLKSELISARTKEAFAVRGYKARQRKQVSPEVVSAATAAMAPALIEMIKVKPVEFKGKYRGYVRVSTKDQTVEQQKGMITRSIRENIQWYVDEGVSAFKTPLAKRQAGKQLLEDLQEGDVVLIWRPDRMFRSLKDMANQVDFIHSKGARIHIVESGMKSDDPFGKLFLSLLGVMAEIESAEIGKSTKHGQWAAITHSEKMRQKMLPKMFKNSRTHKQKCHPIDHVIPLEMKYDIWMEFLTTRQQYGSDRQASMAISNKYLHQLGLPTIGSFKNETVGVYLVKLKKMQAVKFSERRQALIEMLKDAKGVVLAPLHADAIHNDWKRGDRFLKAMSKVPDGWSDKKMLAAMLTGVDHPEQVASVLTAIAGG